MDTDQQVSSISTEDVSEQDTQPLIEIPISIQVEQRGDTPGETVDMKRKQKQRQQFVKIESIDDIPSTTIDGGLDQKQTAQVGIISIRDFFYIIKHSNQSISLISYTIKPNIPQKLHQFLQ